MRRGGTGGVEGALLARSSSSLAVSGAVSISSIVFFVGFDWPFVDERVVVVVVGGGGGLDAGDGGDGND